MYVVHEHLLKISDQNHPLLNAVIRKNGILPPPRINTESLPYYLSRTIVGQQLSITTACAIWQRVESAFKESKLDNFEDFLAADVLDKLVKCGISSRKAGWLLGIGEAFRVGSICEDQLHGKDYDTVVRKLCTLRGVGPWSAEMVSIFYFGANDVWSSGDASLERGVEILLPYGAVITDEIEKYSPYRSYLARHIWLFLDSD